MARASISIMKRAAAMPEIHLPAAFADLEPYLEWSLATEHLRSAKRQASSIDALRSFYAGMMPRMDTVLEFLAGFAPQSCHDEQVRALFHIALALAEVAPAVENYGQPSVIDGYDVARFVAVHQ